MSASLERKPKDSLEFVLIGNPVSHSLSPVMHNALYKELAKEAATFARWRYGLMPCEDEESAANQIERVRSGQYFGMNVTMPYKRLALECADAADVCARAAGGANVLVLSENGRLVAYNTDGHGAAGAIERVSGMQIAGKRAFVCGTGPTSVAIAVAFVERKAAHVALASRSEKRARECVEHVCSILGKDAASALLSVDYSSQDLLVGDADIIVDATPRGMNPDDDAIVDTSLFHEGQVIVDTVYAHGTTALLAGASRKSAIAMDGLEMLVEQAALSVEIWADAMGLSIKADRACMRDAACKAQGL